MPPGILAPGGCDRRPPPRANRARGQARSFGAVRGRRSAQHDDGVDRKESRPLRERLCACVG